MNTIGHATVDGTLEHYKCERRNLIGYQEIIRKLTPEEQLRFYKWQKFCEMVIKRVAKRKVNDQLNYFFDSNCKRG